MINKYWGSYLLRLGLLALGLLLLPSCKNIISGVLGSESLSISDLDHTPFYNSASDSPTITWSSAAAGSPSVNFHYAVGTTPGDTDVVDWANAGSSTTLNLSSLGLSPGQTYYVSLKAVNSKGKESPVVTSPGWTVDTDLPGAMAAPDDGVFETNLNKSPVVTWSAVTDTTSGVAFYELSLGSTPAAADILGWTNVGNVTSHQLTGLPALTYGNTYYVSVRAVDQAGNIGASADGDGFIAGDFCSNKTSWANYNESGAGTTADPFLICTAAQLASIGAGGAALNASYKLMGNIDLAPFYAAPNPEFQIGSCDPSGCASWDGATPYRGTFDGNGHTISNFRFVSPGTRGSSFFASSDSDSVIKNLTLASVEISGSSNVAGLLGLAMWVAVDNVHVSGNVTSTGTNSAGLVGDTFTVRINNSSFSGTLTAGDSRIGGLIGNAYHAVLTNSRSSGTISLSGLGREAGGLVGYLGDSHISASHSSMNVSATNRDIGGLVGVVSESRVANSYSTGNVSGTNRIGGIAGLMGWEARVLNSYATGSVTGSSIEVGGGVGRISEASAKISNSYAVGAVVGGGSSGNVGQFVGSSAGTMTNVYYLAGTSCDSDGVGGSCNNLGSTHSSMADFHLSANSPMNTWDKVGTSADGTDDVWEFSGSAHATLWHESGYEFTAPFLGEGTVANPFLIGSASDFNKIGQNPRWMNAHYSLTQNIDFLGASLKQIGGGQASFTGGFAGGGFTLSNFVNHQPSTDYVGTFGVVGPAGSVTNLNISNVSIEGHTFVAGAIALIDAATVTNVHVVSGNVTGNGSYTGGFLGTTKKSNITTTSSGANVTGQSRTGGYAGNVNTNITSAKATGNVTGTEDVGGFCGRCAFSTSHRVYATGNVTGTGNRVGGLAGHLDWGTINQAYARGTVQGVGYVGGAVGHMSGGTFQDSFATGDVIGVNGSGEVGELIGVYSSGTLTNVHFWSGANCDSDGVGGTCSGTGNPVANEADFFISSNAPLSSWSFPWDWMTTPTYPILSWE